MWVVLIFNRLILTFFSSNVLMNIVSSINLEWQYHEKNRSLTFNLNQRLFENELSR